MAGRFLSNIRECAGFAGYSPLLFCFCNKNRFINGRLPLRENIVALADQPGVAGKALNPSRR